MQFRRITQSVPVIIPGRRTRVVSAADVKVVEVGVAVRVSAQPDKAVGRGVLRDGHVEQLHLVHLAGHVAFLKKKEEKMKVGKCGSWKRKRTIDFCFRAQCIVLSVDFKDPARQSREPGVSSGWTR